MAGRGRGNKGQQAELTEMRCMIEDLSQAVQALQRPNPWEPIWRCRRGDPADTLEGSLEAETVDGRDENPFHEAGTTNQAVRGGLEEWLIHALDLFEEEGGDILEPVYDVYCDEIEEVDILSIQEESLMIQGMIVITKEEGQDWRSHSLRENNQEKKSLADSKIIGYAFAEKFEAKSQEAGVIYAALNKPLGEEQKGENSMQPNENLQLLEEIKGSENKELQEGMLPMLNIQHDFDFSPTASLTNLPTSKFELYNKMADFFLCSKISDATKVVDLFLEEVVRLEHIPTSIVRYRGVKFKGHFWRTSWKKTVPDKYTFDSTWIAVGKFRKIGPDKHVEAGKSFNLNQLKFPARGE
ncbi:hypothetical protein SLEP1_g18782 [Rubroshorea leprosula]|uniref:Uncharacterized protein n=1 Tax=Rubroshorea leprosula TaxID=152421 RepID=A0AAV5J485_9ROSI|nr:hypothetical protein SLEP1_g18782 [Rubroshorea leprosula]